MKNWPLRVGLIIMAFGFILSPLEVGGYIGGILIGYTFGADRLIRPLHHRGIKPDTKDNP